MEEYIKLDITEEKEDEKRLSKSEMKEGVIRALKALQYDYMKPI